MGLDIHGTRFLLYARRLGVDFQRTATIGRQGLHLEPGDLRANLRRFGFACPHARLRQIFESRDGYAEELLAFLGASRVDSLDYSDYEGATHVVDLNRPLPAELGGYSVVIDGGSLEHVFDYPTALASCLGLVRPGGHFMAITPANNFMGHGFYQFSPELFLSVLDGVNGYELVRLIAFEDRPRAPWYRVVRPAKVAHRIMLRSSVPVYLLVLARRTGDERPLRTPPLQSDYLAHWEPGQGTGSAQPVGGRHPLVQAVVRRTPVAIKEAAKVALGRRRRRWRFDPRCFRKIDWKRELSALPPPDGGR